MSGKTKVTDRDLGHKSTPTKKPKQKKVILLLPKQACPSPPHHFGSMLPQPALPGSPGTAMPIYPPYYGTGSGNGGLAGIGNPSYGSGSGAGYPYGNGQAGLGYQQYSTDNGLWI